MADPDEITCELEHERDKLRAELEALSRKAQLEGIVAQASSVLASSGEELGRKAGKIAQENTLPLAVTGIGLGLLAVNALGQSSPSRSVAYDTRETDTVSGFRSPSPKMDGFDARIEAAHKAQRIQEKRKGETGMATYQSHPSQQSTPSIKTRAYAAVEALRARIDEGLEDLPDTAKARIRKAREAAIAAQAQVETEARRVAANTRDAAHENPLLVGALAFAAGAAIAAALPRTTTENRTIGAHRDALFDEAERIFEEEKSKALSQAKALAEAGREKIAESLTSDEAESIAKASGSRGNVKTTVANGARDGAA